MWLGFLDGWADLWIDGTSLLPLSACLGQGYRHSIYLCYPNIKFLAFHSYSVEIGFLPLVSSKLFFSLAFDLIGDDETKIARRPR